MHAGSSNGTLLSDFPYTRSHARRMRIWAFDKVEPILINTTSCAIAFMPYIYSLAWRVTNDDYTIQRPLVMDWRTDGRVSRHW